MKAIRLTITTLFTLFLLTCLAVHIYGLAAPFSDEPVYSHIIHLISYSVCLFTLLKPIPRRALAYAFAAAYPFLYHARCAWISFSMHDKLNGICILVVILMPLIGVWIWKQSSLQTTA